MQLAVLEVDGYAVCPDCGTRVKCGSAGLNNLEKCHRASDACSTILKDQSTTTGQSKRKLVPRKHVLNTLNGCLCGEVIDSLKLQLLSVRS